MEQNNPEKDQEKPQSPAVWRYFLASIWIALVVFFGQNAWASVYENEIRAGMIYIGFSLLLFFGGIISYYTRKFD